MRETAVWCGRLVVTVSKPSTYQDTCWVGALLVADNRISWEVSPGLSRYTSPVKGLVIFTSVLPDSEEPSNRLLLLKIFSKLFENPAKRYFPCSPFLNRL